MPGRTALSAQVLDAIADMRSRGLSYGQIKRRLESSHNVVRSAGAIQWQCLRLGVDTPALSAHRIEPRRKSGRGRPFTAAEDRMIQDLELKGRTSVEIGRDLGRPHNSIIGRLMTLARHAARAEAAEQLEERRRLALISSGEQPDALPLPDPDAPVMGVTDVSVPWSRPVETSRETRDGARGSQKPETAHV